MTELTRDNLHFSRVTPTVSDPDPSAVNCNNPSAVDCNNESSAPVADYIRASIADNTRLAYLSDLKQFELWGGQIPAHPDAVASYLACHAGTLSVATLVRRLAAIAKAHQSRGLISPTRAEIVKATMRGIRRTNGAANVRPNRSLKPNFC